VGLRGVWTKGERGTWQKKLKGLANKVQVQSDIELAHTLIFGKGPGITLNAGTGSIAFGRNPQGKTARAGGLGPLLSDEGSSLWIGKEALKLEYLKTGNLLKVRSYLNTPNTVSMISNHGFQVVKKSFNGGNPSLQAIVRDAQNELLYLIEELITILKWKGPFQLALRGGGYLKILNSGKPSFLN